VQNKNVPAMSTHGYGHGASPKWVGKKGGNFWGSDSKGTKLGSYYYYCFYYYVEHFFILFIKKFLGFFFGSQSDDDRP
jgi:hypothetical protein